MEPDPYIFMEIAGQHDRSGADLALIREAIDYRQKLVLTDSKLKAGLERLSSADIVKLDKYKVPLGGGTKDIQGALNVDLKFYRYRNQPFVPVEFSVAAYRFGHSMIRTDYQLNPATEDPNDVEIFGAEGEDLRGFQERRGGLEIQWERFFEFSGVAQKPQLSRRIDAKIAVGLGSLPFITDR